jgi:SSS family solute:Na+ symporter
MLLKPLDIGIIGAYIVVIMVAGLAVSKLASRNLKSYFLGSNIVPWYVLGVANASGMFDITGTMWLVMTVFVYGVKGAFLPWVWPVFNQIFLMVFLATWLRRSNVMTGAEWITTRFGDSLGASLSYISVVLFAIVSVIGMLAYDFRGMGKFAQILLPWQLSANTYAMVLMGLTTIYVIFGGMLSVTVTDVIQYVLMTVASVFIAVVALQQTTAAQIQAVVPHGWQNLLFGWKLNLDWSQHIPALNEQIAGDGWELFGIFFMIMMFKGILNSAAGPAPNYDMQRILSTRNPREAAKMSGFVSVALFLPRYLMVVGITVLGLVAFQDLTAVVSGGKFDAEKVLPTVIARLPAGLTGFVLAGLLAAFMSTFTATVNAGASYIVNDLYKKHINSHARDKTYVYASYLCSVLIVIVGIVFGLMTNVLNWYWWRFNGMGYFAGMMAGIVAAILVPLPLALANQSTVWSLERNMALFPIILAISLLTAVVVTLRTRPDDEEVLKRFYKQVRPWGFWGPIRDKVLREDPAFVPNGNFARDMVNVAVGIVWQLTFVLIPTYLLIRNYRNMWISLVVLAGTSFFLKKNWYDKLDREPATVPAAGPRPVREGLEAAGG